MILHVYISKTYCSFTFAYLASANVSEFIFEKFLGSDIMCLSGLL